MIDLKDIPYNSGCYLFKDKFGKVIYVGKAKNLNNRVKSYFQKSEKDTKTKALISNISNIDFFITDNEVEALILENNLIKKYKPKYNIDLKDSKRYAYIEVTSEEYPRILIARKKEGNGKFYGPFVSGISRDYVLEALKKIFKIRTCKRLPKKECIRYSLGLCSAPCIKNISKEKYIESINSAKMVLSGKTKNLTKVLFNKMKSASSIKDYERALEIKNQIKSIKELEERQKVERTKEYDEDIINYIINQGKVYLMIFSSKKGALDTKQTFEFEESPSFLEDFILQYYTETKAPKEIIISKNIDKSFEEYLTKIKKEKVIITNPKIGEKKDLLDLVKKNIEILIFGDNEKIIELQKELSLNESPKVIECFDISHLSGTSTVASMVQFRNAKPDKANYRRYKIRSIEGPDDYASIREVINRRYSKLKNEGLSYPNLIIVDGGKGQLSSALGELEKLNIKIPIISIAKREEEIFLPGKENPLLLSEKSNALKLVQSIRDEAHRFAINYNRLLRKKKIRQD